MSKESISLEVNGSAVTLELPPRTHLADALREELGLTATHIGCEQGVCGACTLMIDGVPQRSCITLAASCAGASITTLEGLEADPLMASLRENFSSHHALQCGYCTPGMLATGYDIVRRLPGADIKTIRRELAGNLCRCTGYSGIVEAIAATLEEYPAGHPWRETQPPRPAPIVAERAKRIAIDEAAAQETANAAAPVTGADGKTELRRSQSVALPLEDLWRVLSDIETVAACLPGVELTEIGDGGQVRGRLSVAVGPMTASFEGKAEVAYDEASHSGSVVGGGEDRLGRSAAEGEVRFAAAAEGQGSRLEVAIRYAVTGPFAQFSRGALVADVVSRLMERFADNLVRAAEGKEIDEGGGGLNAAELGWSLLRSRAKALVANLRRLFRG